jgi:hypothetical protein
MHEVSNVLLKQGFKLSETINHKAFNTFILRRKWQYSILHLSYILMSSCFFALTLYLIAYNPDSILYGLLLSGCGILFSFLLIPLHESIHYVMFKFFGAKKVFIKPYLSQFYFLTISHHFAIGKEEIKWIALMPFMTITALGFILFFFSNYQWQIVIISAILFHTSICSSDFRLVDFFISKEKEYKMYTDNNEDMTYLYCRK